MEQLAAIGGWLWFVLWVGMLLAASLLVYLGLGGNFVILALALIHAAVTGFDPIGWRLLVILLLLAVAAEVVEFVLGTFYVARKGASRYGVIGAFCGGIAGAAAGTALMPVVGSVLGSFAGGFAGAILGEYWRQRRVEPSLRVGGHAFLGRLAAVFVKHAAGLGMILLILRKTWPGASPG